MSSETATMNSSKASLSLVPKSETTKSLAPGGWRSMTACPTAATSDVAPGRTPASSSEMPSAAAVATTPAIAAVPSTRLAARAGCGPSRDVRAALLTEPSSRLGVTFACRRSARGLPRRRAASSGPTPGHRAVRSGSAARRRGSGPRRTGPSSSGPAATTWPAAEHERVAEPGRDLLDVVRDQHDRARTGSGGQPGQVGEQRLARPEIEAGGRLVEEQQVRVGHQRASDRGAPPLARRQRPERHGPRRAPARGRRAASRARSRSSSE